jgi:hypothetical protein
MDRFRDELYKEFESRGLMTKDHLFKVVRSFYGREEKAVNYVTGQVVDAFITNPDYESVEYICPNGKGAIDNHGKQVKAKTAEDENKKPKNGVKGKKAKPEPETPVADDSKENKEAE